MTQKLTRSSTDKAIYGVCGGLAEFFGLSSFIVRLLFFIYRLRFSLGIHLSVMGIKRKTFRMKGVSI